MESRVSDEDWTDTTVAREAEVATPQPEEAKQKTHAPPPVRAPETSGIRDRVVICVTVVVAAAVALGALGVGSGLIHAAAPNEWLVVVENGQMTKSGIGLRHINWRPWSGEQVVRFPSSIHRVKFKAQQVTREMQGIEVEGFAIWTVFREGDGPFRAFRNLDGMSPRGLQATNTHMAAMAESVIRAQVANLTIEKVVTGRDAMRQKLTHSMMEVVKGWGVWLETVEVTDVRILSSTLFDNLQTKFREDARHAAEKQRLEVQQKIDLAKEKSALELAKERATARREQAVFEADQRAAELQEQEAAAAKRHQIMLEEHARSHALDLRRMEDAAKLEEARSAHQRAEEGRAADARLAQQAKVLKMEQTMTKENMDMGRLVAIKEIFGKLPLRDVKLVNVASGVAGGGNGTLDGMLGGLAAVQGMQG